MLYVSHNMNTIRQLCDRCIVLDKGKVVFEGDVEDSIEVYMGVHGSRKTNYEFTKAHHINPRSTNNFVIHELRILNQNAPLFNYGVPVSLELDCITTKVWTDVALRFEIHYQDGSKVGTMLSIDKVTLSEGRVNTISLQMDTSHIAPGRYFVNIIAYQDNTFGSELFLDGVYPGFYFEISNELSNENKLLWMHNHWGHVHLHDMQLRLL